MKSLIVLAAIVAVSLLSAPRAEAANYCLDGETGITCGFVTMQQCMEAMFGNGGACIPEPEMANETRLPVRHQTATNKPNFVGGPCVGRRRRLFG